MEQLRPCLGLGFGAGWKEGIFLRTFACFDVVEYFFSDTVDVGVVVVIGM